MLKPISRPPLCPGMAAYWQTFQAAGQANLPLRDTPNAVTDAIIAFVSPDAEGALSFVGPNHPTRDSVLALRDMGQNVLLSLGGGGIVVSLDTKAKTARFSESLYALVCGLCVNGLDIDVELGIPALGTPTCPEGPLAHLIQGIDHTLAHLPKDFLLTMAPETANLVGGMDRYEGAFGNYIPLILHFQERITRVHMQYYNSGPMPGIDGRYYTVGTVPFAAAMTDALIQGFPIADTGVRFPGLPQDRVAIGLPATPQAASSGYLTPGEIDEALRWLFTGYRGPDAKRMPPYPHLGGLMTWSLQWDATQGFAFVRHGARAFGIVR